MSSVEIKINPEKSRIIRIPMKTPRPIVSQLNILPQIKRVSLKLSLEEFKLALLQKFEFENLEYYSISIFAFSPVHEWEAKKKHTH